MNLVLLRAIMPAPAAAAACALFVQPLEDAMHEFEISKDLRRQAAFLAQVAHETGELKWLRELASGEAYEGRIDLGNTQKGDGPRFRGRGLLHITGRANYTVCGQALGLDLISKPELLEQPVPAARSAGWFWARYKRLNSLADLERFGSITRLINGGYNGLDERIKYYLRARRVLGIS